MAHTIWMQDLDRAESQNLVAYILNQRGAGISPEGLDRLVVATGGDRYLIPMLANHCSSLVAEQQREITIRDVNHSIGWFLNSQTKNYPALGETVRALEADPVALWNLLDILDRGRVGRNSLRIDIEKEIDSLRLTGAIRVEEDNGQKFYCIRNEVYQAYLKKTLLVSKVVDTLRTGGLVEEAITYLEGQVVLDRRLYKKLLSTVVDSISVAPNEFAAYGFLARCLKSIFRIPKVRIYAVDQDHSLLKVAGEAGFEGDPEGGLSLHETGRPECRAYHSRQDEVSQSASGEPVLVVPIPGTRADGVLAVIAMYGYDPQQEPDNELVPFLTGFVARAIQEVMNRERQLRYFDERVYQSSTSLDRVYTATIETALKAVPAAENGWIFLWNPDLQRLVIVASTAIAPEKGLSKLLACTVQLRKGQGYVGWAYENNRPVLLKDATADKRTEVFEPIRERSAICVPLEAWGRVIGVLCLQNLTKFDAFRAQDLEILSSFGGHAALAIQHLRFTTELYELGMRINRRDVRLEDIFREAVHSIRHVLGAKAANMFLLQYTDDPALSLREGPSLSISDGFPKGFDDEIRCRPDGLTASVLRDKQPRFMTDLHSPPGVNPLARVHGVQAYICLPLMIQDKISGVLFVHYDEPHAFTDNEIRMLSLFANQTALAIENAQQRDRLAMTDTVVWMGITFSSLAHKISQIVGQMNNAEHGLRRALNKAEGTTQYAFETLDEIHECVSAIGEIPQRSLLPAAQDETIHLNEVLLKEIPRWCEASNITPEFTGDAGPVAVTADRYRLAFLLEGVALILDKSSKI